MAVNKRIPVKWIRDAAKKAYVKQDKCFVCGTTENLELHHLHSISVLLEDWCKKHEVDISTDEAVLAIRDQFISEHKHEIYDLVYTLCNAHHVKLHGIFGKSPANFSVGRQEKWLSIQKAKAEGTYEATPSPFTKFIKEK